MADETGRDRDHWSRVAAEWMEWARAPDHDAFWAYRASLAAYVGRGSGQALDVGCGEGRVSRLLRSCGYRVTAVDPVGELVEAARAARSADDYAVAAADRLPFPDGRFDLVVAYNILMDVADVAASISEMRRILRPDGRLLLSIVHPLADLADLVSSTPEERVSYWGRRRFETVERRDGLNMHFAGWTQPLESYVAALEAARLAVTSLKEPRADCGEGRQHMERWSRMPLFLWLTAVPLAAPARLRSRSAE